MLAEADLAGLVIADVENADETGREIVESYSTDAIGITTDVSDSAQVGAMVDEAVKRFYRIDILVNNAGIIAGQGPFSVETVTGSGECVSPSSGAV